MATYLDVINKTYENSNTYYVALTNFIDSRRQLFDHSLDGYLITSYRDCAQVLRSKDFTKFAEARPKGSQSSGEAAVSEIEAIMKSHFGMLDAQQSKDRRNYWQRRINNFESVSLSNVAQKTMSVGLGSNFDLNADILRPFVRRVAFQTLGIIDSGPELNAALDNYISYLDGRISNNYLQTLRSYLVLLEQVWKRIPRSGEAGSDFKYEVSRDWAVDAAFVLAAAHESAAYLVGTALTVMDQEKDLPEVSSKQILSEALRYDSPVQLVARYVATNVQVAGLELPKGSLVYCHLGLANRDPIEFPNADQFNPQRENMVAPISFGGGSWSCIGRQLAMKQSTAMFDTLVEERGRFTIEREKIRFERASAAREFAALPCRLR